MKSRQKPSLFLLAIMSAVTLVLAACSSSSSSSSSSSGAPSKKLVYFIFNGYTPPYFAPMAAGVQAAASYYPGLDIKIVSASASASTEATDIKEAVSAGAKGIILNAIDTSVTAAAAQAAAQGVPIVGIDRDVSAPSARFAFIGDNDTLLGAQEAQSCIQGATALHLPRPWHTVIMQGTLGATTAVDRVTGAEQALKPYEANGSVTVVLNQSANFDTATGRTMISEFLAKTTNVQMIISGNDAMALGAIEALQTAGLTPGKKVIVCGVDAQPESLAAIKAGTQYNTVTHSPYLEAVWAVEAMANYLSNHTLPPASLANHDVLVPQVVVTQANLSTESAWGTPSTIPPLPYGQSSSHPS